MFAIIVNPASGSGESGALIASIQKMLEARGHDSRVYPTQFAGDEAKQVRKALEDGCLDIIGMGGDGTLSEMVDPLADSGATLYIVPKGTGNDFARVIGLPKDPIKALAMQLDSPVRSIDCASANGKAFINVSGSGFDVEVLRKTEELKQIYPGEKAYSKAVIETISKYEAFEADVEIDDQPAKRVRATIVEIANGQYFGGGMKVAPGAQIDDGLLDVVVVDIVPHWAIPFLLPLFVKGWHVRLPIAHVVRAKKVVVRSSGMTVNIDGRLEKKDEVRYEIMRNALNMRLPQAADK